MVYIKKFKIDVYQTNITLKIGHDITKLSNQIYKKHGYEADDKKQYRGHVYYLDIDQFYILFTLEDITHGLIAHEISHLVDDICEINSVNDKEARAFLCEFITTQIYNFLILKHITIYNASKEKEQTNNS